MKDQVNPNPTKEMDDEFYIANYFLICKTNYTAVRNIYIICAIHFPVMYLLSLYNSYLSAFSFIFAATSIIFILALIPVLYIPKFTYYLTATFYYFAAFIILAIGIYINTFGRPDEPAIIFFVLFLAVPITYIDKPIRSLSTIVISFIAFLIVAYLSKRSYPNIFITDFINSITVLAITMTTAYNTRKKFLENLQTRVNIQNQSKIDALTGLSNRDEYKKKVKAINKSLLSNNGVAVGIFCINNLKIVNDTLGYEAGDDMVKSVAYIVKRIFFRSSIFRVSGYQIVVILERKDFEARHKLLSIFDSELIKANDGAIGLSAMSVSYGIASYNKLHDSSYADIYSRAERIMYEKEIV